MTFMARYSGVCPECGERWQPGDLIVGKTAPMTRGLIYRHAVCPDPTPTVGPGEVSCAACFLIHPEGACDR